MERNFDAIVIGAGHAGVEAANALTVLGKKTLLLSLSLDAVSFMACNPNIGGTAKGHLVRELDALGGLMGIYADKATIQTRMLNLGNGPAVHSLRNQVDKELYHRLIKKRLEQIPNLTIMQGEAAEIIFDNKEVAGVKTVMGLTFNAKAVVIASGVYLNSKIIIGDYQKESGPNGFSRSEKLTDCLIKSGLPIRRFKTGTPPRVLRKTVDFSVMEPQFGDIGIPKLSFMTDEDIRNDYACYLTYTNLNTHNVIYQNLDKAPLYNGSISGTGPRYCPSIEDKVVRFKDKERHQIFIEPEGADTDEMYVQGLSTSMPYDIQEAMVKSIKGLENAEITRYGYAIEYDCIDPLAILPTLAAKGFSGLYTAGQINGSSGYEEAAVQGYVAGLNAARYLDNEEGFIFKREDSYIGVLIDDLVTKGTNEPYRMMTSRAEHRLHLRQDNADIRLTETGRMLKTVTDERYRRFCARLDRINDIKNRLNTYFSPNEVAALFEVCNQPMPKGGISLNDILKRVGISAKDIKENLLKDIDEESLRYVEIELKYQGYLEKQQKAIKEALKMEQKLLPDGINYHEIEGLRLEARQKLAKIAPKTLAQAARISGVTPADITVLILYLHKI